MKSILKKFVMLAGILMACGQVSHATLGLSVSSQTNVAGVPFVFFARANESVLGLLTSTSPALQQGTTVNFEQSLNGYAWTVLQSTVSGGAGLNGGITVTMPPANSPAFYRWNIISFSSSAAGSPLTLTIRDVDDNYEVKKNNKGQDAVYFNDDSVNVFGTLKADRTQYQTASSSGIVTISSNTQLVWLFLPPPDKINDPFVAAFPSTATIIDKSFVILQSTGTGSAGGGGIVLTACPTITTATATNGDRIEFKCNNSSITFTDFISLNTRGASSALKLGAATRACGTGDTLALIYFNGFWQEEYFVNVLSE